MVGGCLVLVMQDGNEFATLRCSQAILERLTSENAGPSRKIRSLTRAGQCLLREARGSKGWDWRTKMCSAIYSGQGGAQIWVKWTRCRSLTQPKQRSILTETWQWPEYIAAMEQKWESSSESIALNFSSILQQITLHAMPFLSACRDRCWHRGSDLLCMGLWGAIGEGEWGMMASSLLTVNMWSIPLVNCWAEMKKWRQNLHRPPSHPLAFSVIFELIIQQDRENPVTETGITMKHECSAVRARLKGQKSRDGLRWRNRERESREGQTDKGFTRRETTARSVCWGES